MRVVLDTNVLIASIANKSAHHWVWQFFQQGKFDLCVTTDILDEYAEIIEKYFSPDVAEATLTRIMLSKNVIQTIRYFEWNAISQDIDDNKFFDCAVASGAEFIVSEDKHFNVLKNVPFPSVSAIKISEFKVILGV